MRTSLLAAAPLALATTALALGAAHAGKPGKGEGGQGYEVWASDQSNSVAGVAGNGLRGSYLWIWDSRDIERQLAGGPDAEPLSCARNNNGRAPRNVGPCDLLEVFPQDLREFGADGRPTGNRLSDLSGFGRLHGMLPDPQNRYVTANIFAPGGGYVGIIDTETKEAVGLFRVTGTNVGGGTDVRSVHMSFWDSTGSAVIIANLNGKVLERIDVTRNGSGKIKSLTFNKSASLGVGKGMEITAEATVFRGRNAHGRKMIGEVAGSYDEQAFADLTPNGFCKENGCAEGPDSPLGGRPNNVIICPIPSENRKAYITMGGGGLLVANTDATPMAIVGEYDNQVLNGAGCGGGQADGSMFLNAGVSASGAGATWSTFTMYKLDDSAFSLSPNLPNSPSPELVFADPGNTATGGNQSGPAANTSGQLPGVTTRRDAHGVAVTTDGGYIHNVDRIQNVVEVFDTQTGTRTSYDLTSANGQGSGFGACFEKSVRDDAGLPVNDPAPDLLERTPDGKYLMIALRGPAPVSVQHSAQGSCPGVGIVELLNGGSSGRLVGVLRSTNSVDDSPQNAPGGYPYAGAERSDIHGATVVTKGRRPARGKGLSRGRR
ncbi:hypothetical protein [Parvularcula maris]|uniref:Uncharacterized protein n=1 Tax=Parvularcula maris TaxID=2965077 RepID=A0A9X2RKX5_9PROT|nr:hypothetical protein [Parvularcula maris]MCQ8186228.1 hypothetical protein [Parvularcula maris]